MNHGMVIKRRHFRGSVFPSITKPFNVLAASQSYTTGHDPELSGTQTLQ